MRSVLCTLSSLVCFIFSSMPAGGHLQSENNALPGNDSVSIEQFNWAYNPDSASVSGQFSIRNNTALKTIRAITFSLVAFDKKGVLLQENGTATIKRLIYSDTIEAGNTGNAYFKDAYHSGQISEVRLKRVVVEFTNGSLELLRNEQ